MAQTTAPDFMHLVRDAIATAVTQQVGEAYDRAIKETQELLERQKDQIVTGIVLNITKMLVYDYAGQDVRITIKKLDDISTGFAPHPKQEGGEKS